MTTSAGCSHACPGRCHAGPCPPCEVNLKLKCHCGINNLYLKCFQFTASSEDEKAASLSCTDQCPKVRCVDEEKFLPPFAIKSFPSISLLFFGTLNKFSEVCSMYSSNRKLQCRKEISKNRNECSNA